MIPINDYHMHTPLCGHAVGAPAEYAQRAIDLGLKEIGFSDHAPFICEGYPSFSMGRAELAQYYKMIEDVRDQFKDRLTIKIAIEADFMPGFENRTQALLDDYPYDYVIGSVHFINNWGFDHPDARGKWDACDVNHVYRDYFELLRQCARSGMYDIMAHVDLVKKFGHRATDDLSDDVRATAEVFKECGVVVEINTAGLRKPAKEMYPSLSHLKIYYEAGVPLTFGSDAHDPNDVGRDFDKAADLAKAAGYTEYVLFSKRAIEQTIQL